MYQCKSPPLPKKEILLRACDKITKPRNGKRRSLVGDREYIQKTIKSKTKMDRFLVFPMISTSKSLEEGVWYMPIVHSCIAHDDRDLLNLVIECRFYLNEIHEDLTPMQYALSIGRPDIASLISRNGGV
jgi:hypothetical protein